MAISIIIEMQDASADIINPATIIHAAVLLYVHINVKHMQHKTVAQNWELNHATFSNILFELKEPLNKPYAIKKQASAIVNIT